MGMASSPDHQERFSSQVIAVIGATGQQGGGLVHALQGNTKYSIRAVTRNPRSEKAQALSKLSGVQVEQADLDDVTSLKKAFEGAWGVFLLTNYWEHFDTDKEIQQFKNMADAAKAANVKRVVMSSMEDTREFVKKGMLPLLHGDHYYVPHFDAKGEASKYVAATCPQTTILLTSFYYENFLQMGPKPGPDGKLAITMPMGTAALPMVAASDIGKFAAKLLADDSTKGKTVGVAGDCLPIEQIAQLFSKVLGKTVVYNPVPVEVYAKLFGSFQGADDLANMFGFYRDCAEVFQKHRNLAMARKICPELISFSDWLNKNKNVFACCGE